MNRSEEGIASNVLADRLKRLVEEGLLSRRDDPTHKQKAIYSLTEPAIQLVPLLAQMGAWGRRHAPVSKELSIRAQLLEDGGQRTWDAFMDELRGMHLGAPAPKRSVLAKLQAAFEKACREQAPPHGDSHDEGLKRPSRKRGNDRRIVRTRRSR
jgi:DNA-binding MarR family transcriptional regulator